MAIIYKCVGCGSERSVGRSHRRCSDSRGVTVCDACAGGVKVDDVVLVRDGDKIVAATGETYGGHLRGTPQGVRYRKATRLPTELSDMFVKLAQLPSDASPSSDDY